MVDGSKLDGLMDRRNINMISEILIENLLNISIYNNKIIIIKSFSVLLNVFGELQAWQLFRLSTHPRF